MSFWLLIFIFCLGFASHGMAGYIVDVFILLGILIVKIGKPIEMPQTYILPKKDHEERMIQAKEQAEKLAISKLKEKMTELIREYRGVIPFEALAEVITIKENVLNLLPYLESLNTGDDDFHNTIKIITDYLPKTLKMYSDLPRDFSENHKTTEKSAEDILIDQLTIMSSQIQAIVNHANKKKLDALIIQGEFLKNKFPKQ